jgi:Cu2+-exporting ATPase
MRRVNYRGKIGLWQRKKYLLDELLDKQQPQQDVPKIKILERIQNGVKLLFNNTRQQQINEMASANQTYQIHSLKGKHDIKMPISAISLGLATAGALFYPPLSLLSLPGLFFISIDVFKNAYQALVKEKKAHVDLLVAIIVAVGVMKGYFWVVNFQLFLGMCSRQLTEKIKSTSKEKIIDIFGQQPNRVWVLVDGVEIEVPFESLSKGNMIVAQAGSMIPVDGQITDGTASIDQHMLTGESQPVEKGRGDQVYALTVVLAGKIYIEVEKTGQETTAAQIGKILNKTVNFKTDMQLQIEEASDRAVLPLLVGSGILLPLLGPMGSIALLNSHPKYKITIATYIDILRFFEQASLRGLLIKDGRVFERLNQVDTVVFDKTGTLTQEQPHVGRIHTCNGYRENELLVYAATAEMKQSHPIAKAILREAEIRGVSIAELEDAEYKIGYGLVVTIADRVIRVGSERFIEMEGIAIPPAIKQSQESCHLQGHTLVLVTVNREVAGAIELHATIRPEASAIIRGLRQRNIKSMYIISGDHERATRALAESLEIDHYFAETLPEQKADLIDQLQQAGHSVCYIGDGINDAIALRKAAVSISLRGASAVATDTAQVILMEQSLTRLCDLFDLAKDFQASMTRTSALVLVPHLIGAAGIFFWHWGLLTSITVNQIGLLLGLGNTLLSSTRQPLLSSNTTNAILVDKEKKYLAE